MPDTIITRLRAAYMRNPAEALNMLPELFEAEERGEIIEKRQNRRCGNCWFFSYSQGVCLYKRNLEARYPNEQACAAWKYDAAEQALKEESHDPKRS